MTLSETLQDSTRASSVGLGVLGDSGLFPSFFSLPSLPLFLKPGHKKTSPGCIVVLEKQALTNSGHPWSPHRDGIQCDNAHHNNADKADSGCDHDDSIATDDAARKRGRKVLSQSTHFIAMYFTALVVWKPSKPKNYPLPCRSWSQIRPHRGCKRACLSGGTSNRSALAGAGGFLLVKWMVNHKTL